MAESRVHVTMPVGESREGAGEAGATADDGESPPPSSKQEKELGYVETSPDGRFGRVRPPAGSCVRGGVWRGRLGVAEEAAAVRQRQPVLGGQALRRRPSPSHPPSFTVQGPAGPGLVQDSVRARPQRGAAAPA